jgi:DNA-directed RNA polymerase subunit M/transcription elongation factor TFIIS
MEIVEASVDDQWLNLTEMHNFNCPKCGQSGRIYTQDRVYEKKLVKCISCKHEFVVLPKE